MSACLIYDPAMAQYRFPAPHPMRPERFTGAVDLMRAWSIEGTCASNAADPSEPPGVRPAPASDDTLALVHDRSLIAAVRAAGGSMPEGRDTPRPTPAPGPDAGAYGIGPGDTPAFPLMHEAAALVAGGTTEALRRVLDGETTRAFNPSGGMHHAHRDRVAGFCIYNDCAVTIAQATQVSPGLKVAYVDIDAHHGDGVQEAFLERADVLTLSVHESGQYLYPGTGALREMGEGHGRGFTLNVPLPPFAGSDCYLAVLERAIAPALSAFRPDVIVLQGGADTHRDDPLTHLDLTVRGYVDLVAGIRSIADELCEGRLVMTGGGGYEYRSAVPRMWACAFAVLCEAEIPEDLPAQWLSSHVPAPVSASAENGMKTFEERSNGPDSDTAERASTLTRRALDELQERHPLLGGHAL